MHDSDNNVIENIITYDNEDCFIQDGVTIKIIPVCNFLLST